MSTDTLHYHQIPQARRNLWYVAVLLVLLSLGGSCGFVYWYLFKDTASSAIALKSADEAAMRNAAVPKPLTPVRGRQGPGGRRFGGRPMMGLRPVGTVINRQNFTTVATDQFSVTISPAAKPGADQPVEMRLQGYGAYVLPMPLELGIARRVARDDLLAKQLSVRPDQLKALVDMTQSATVRGRYAAPYPVLPMTDQDLALIHKDYAAYAVAHQPGGAAERTLIDDVRQAGPRSEDLVRAEYTDLARQVKTILSADQIRLYTGIITGRVKPAGVVNSAGTLHLGATAPNYSSPTTRPK